MPTYEYECKGCGKTFEVFQGMSDKPLSRCPDCGGKKVQRLISGGHRPKGMIIMSGHGTRAGCRISGAGIMDVAPSILYLFGTPIPADMDGRVITDAFDRDYVARHPVQYSSIDAGVIGTNTTETVYTEEDAQAVEERLRGLGYVD